MVVNAKVKVFQKLCLFFGDDAVSLSCLSSFLYLSLNSVSPTHCHGLIALDISFESESDHIIHNLTYRLDDC